MQVLTCINLSLVGHCDSLGICDPVEKLFNLKYVCKYKNFIINFNLLDHNISWVSMSEYF